jgi:molybdopterin molybdotransferase
MTGAPVPSGADSVIRIEDTDGGQTTVVVRATRDSGRNIRRSGEDVRAGQRPVAAGTRLDPAHLGVLASIGAAEIEVYRKPRVAILVTGDEIVDVDCFEEVLAGRRIVSSNSYTLRALLERAGADVLDLGIATDEQSVIDARLMDATGCDLLVTSGGVSVGAFDLTRQAVRNVGGEILVDRVRMRPGAPLGFGTIGRMLWLGLPGNPVSAAVTFEVFGRAILRRLSGETACFPALIPVRVADEIAVPPQLTHFMRVVISVGDGFLEARLTGSQSSGMLTSVAMANGLLVVPEGTGDLKAGSRLRAILKGEPAIMAETLGA